MKRIIDHVLEYLASNKERGCMLWKKTYVIWGALPVMCYTVADAVTIPKGMFYVLDRATGKRYKAAPTRDEAMENWKAGRLQ